MADLTVSVWPAGSEAEEPIEIRDVDYVSFVAYNTYGKPAIIAPGTDGFESGFRGRVVYINPANIAAVEVERR